MDLQLQYLVYSVYYYYKYSVIYPIRLPFVIYDLELDFNKYQDLKYIHLRLDLNILIGIYLTTKHY